MPSSDYTNAVGGGLKLKGTKDAGVKKHKKKKPKPEVSSKEAETEKEQEGETSTVQQNALADKEDEDALADQKSVTMYKDAGKTEAQRKHEEMRRKRLDDRLKREGVKTHKERVEELNKYLSGLSEHHDMPRIGPG